MLAVSIWNGVPFEAYRFAGVGGATGIGDINGGGSTFVAVFACRSKVETRTGSATLFCFDFVFVLQSLLLYFFYEGLSNVVYVDENNEEIVILLKL
ncbi:unnamed protein product [Vicia faba]|uniref:Uncharacterized protein n=1 Tax=Vicia faba TaxID=3906 RepID=A0AAV1ATJ9_VICFA|nr:unnamed protein product [Vicia faba]